MLAYHPNFYDCSCLLNIYIFSAFRDNEKYENMSPPLVDAVLIGCGGLVGAWNPCMHGEVSIEYTQIR